MPHDRWGKALWGKTGWQWGLPLEGTVGQNALKLLRWPICGALTYGWPWILTERLNVELPSKGRRTDGEGPRAHLCLQSEAAAERQIVHDVLSQPAVIASSRVADPLDEQMHLTLPLAGQLVVNECALALLWQHRRPFFLVRLRAPGSVLSQLPLDLFELVLKEFIGTGYRASVYA